MRSLRPGFKNHTKMTRMLMNTKVIRTIAIVVSSLLAVGIVEGIFLLMGTGDNALKETFIALLASGFSLDIYLRLSAKFLEAESSN